MPSELVQANAVVTAQFFNPSLFTSLWLVREGFVEEATLLPGSVYSDVVVQVQTQRFVLNVVPQQLAFTPRVGYDAGELVAEKLGRIVTTLQHTPYTATGLNFTWHVDPGLEGLTGFTRRLFFQSGSPLLDAFDVEDAHFGAYMSKNVYGCRLKLDVKPIMIGAPGQVPEPRVQFMFNFHSDVASERPANDVVGHLRRWADCQALAGSLMQRTLEESP